MLSNGAFGISEFTLHDNFLLIQHFMMLSFHC